MHGSKVTNELYVGLMSGTSLDAIDAVIVSIDANRIELLNSHQLPIPHKLRQQILAISSDQETTASLIGHVDHQLGKLYATAVIELLSQAKIHANSITAIGNHGQTVCHQPIGESPFSMQLGDANLIAALTGIDTIADFRRLDIALGGQGAPLAPAFHRFLFLTRDSTTVVLNIGGIANITVLATDETVTGFDTGPGNILMDAWCEQQTNKSYDHNAEWALQGQLNHALLQRLLADDYLSLPPPKSTGREHYYLQWLEKRLVEPASPQDVQRTLCEFTALATAQQIQNFKCGSDNELLVCGGGAHNPLVMQLLQQHLPDWRVIPTSERGISVDYMEAMAFAWLARQRIHNEPGNLPAVTGATQQASLGVVYAAPN